MRFCGRCAWQQKVAFTILRQRSSGRRVKLIDRKHERVVRAFTKFPLARVRSLTAARDDWQRKACLLCTCVRTHSDCGHG